MLWSILNAFDLLSDIPEPVDDTEAPRKPGMHVCMHVCTIITLSTDEEEEGDGLVDVHLEGRVVPE